MQRKWKRAVKTTLNLIALAVVTSAPALAADSTLTVYDRLFCRQPLGRRFENVEL